MSSVIKSRDAAASAKVRPLSMGSPSEQPALPAPGAIELALLREELETARGLLAQCDAQTEQLRLEVDEAFKRGQAEGRESGLQEVADRRAESLAALDAGIQRAVGRFGDEMAGCERLAAALAVEAVGKLLGDPGERSEMLHGMIRTQLAALETESVVGVLVSADDFPDAAELSRLEASIRRPGILVCTSDELESGDCRIRLVLGTVEIGIGQQWGALGATLRQLAQPEVVA